MSAAVWNLNRMHTVMITAPAEGVGRTTLTAGLGLYAQQVEDGLVVSLDADNDPDLLQWARQQSLSRPITAAWDDSCTPENLDLLEREGVALVLIDCPLLAQNERIANVLAAVDLVLILVRPQSEDLDTVGSLIDLVESEGKPFIFVINQSDDDEDMTTATVMSLAQHGTVSPIILPHCEALAAFNFENDEATSYDQLDYAKEIAPLWAYVRERLTHYAERTEPPGQMPSESETARQDYRQHATFILPEMVYPCEVLEISSESLLFASDVELPAGARLRFNLPYLGQLYCEVVASHPEGVEARFVIDGDRRAEFYEMVADIVNQGRELPLSA